MADNEERKTDSARPNAQNSDFASDNTKRPSEKHIEEMYAEHEREKGQAGEMLRPSERPPHYDYRPLKDKPEGD